MRQRSFSFLLLAVAFGAVFTLTGCGANANNQPLDKRLIRVVTTTTMITDAVKIVGGKRVEVIGLMGPGVDPHEHEASAGDVKSMERADVIFHNGLHLEGKMGDVLAQLRGGAKTFAVTDSIPKDQLRKVPEFEGGFDPHVWFDVTLWSKAVEHIRAKFIAGRRIPAMFVESSVNPKNIRAVQDAVKDLGFKVSIGGELFSDSLGDADKPDGTYIGMMKANIATMVKALAPSE